MHGELRLGRDVTGLVLDPSFRATAVESAAEHVRSRFGMAIEWAPPLSGGGPDWIRPSARPHARSRIADALASGEAVTAAWIGRDLWSAPSGTPERAAAARASRYLWNRLLLTQD